MLIIENLKNLEKHKKKIKITCTLNRAFKIFAHFSTEHYFIIFLIIILSRIISPKLFI